jgi:hypothetical protein
MLSGLMDMEDVDENGDSDDRIGSDVETTPNEAADPQAIIDAKIPADIREKYELLSYRNAAIILSEARRAEFDELLDALRTFTISTAMIRKAGGNRQLYTFQTRH